MKKAQKYFISGLLFLLPLWILYIVIKTLSGVVTNVVSINVLFGFIISLFVITAIGFLVRRIIKRYIGKYIYNWSKRPGFIGLCMRGFMQIDEVSEKAREAFTNPILYKVDDGIYKLGFVTDADQDILGTQDTAEVTEAQPATDAVWVYAPLPVTMLGELILVEKRKIQHINPEQKESIPLFIMTAGLVEQSQ